MKNIKLEGVCIPAVVLYMAAISIALMYTICRSVVITSSVAMTAVCTAVYLAFYILRGKKLLSVITAAVMGVVVFAMLNAANAFSFASEGFMDFIFTASEEYNAQYAACAIAVFSVFIGFVCYYFSSACPRGSILITPALVPLILSTRTAGGLPAWMVYFMVGAYVLCCMVISRPATQAGDDSGKYTNTIHRTALGTVIAAAATLIAFLVPKSTVTPYGDALNEVFSSGRGYMNVSDRLTNFVQNSSVNRGANKPEQNLLFVVTSDKKVNIDRWTFDEYHGSDGWTSNEDYNTGFENWGYNASLRSSADMIISLKEAAQNGGLEEYAERLEKIPDYTPSIGRMVISIADGSTARVVLHPIGTYSVKTSPQKVTYKTPRDEIFFGKDPDPNISYIVDYDRDRVNEYFLREFTRDEIYDMIEQEMFGEYVDFEAANVILNDMTNAELYLDNVIDTGEGISERIAELAAEITEGIESEYDKALALEKWFGEAEFVYDLDYVPARTEAEYFMFTSKRGICSDYATALTLLARAAGLPARYTEGFVLSDDNLQSDGRYYVTSDKAHAYTQIYISGYGWMNFDGTRYAKRAEKGAGLEIWVYIAAGIAVILIVLLIVFRKKLSELLFSVSYRLFKPETRVRRAYRRINREACEIARVRSGTLTTGETASVIANALGMKEESEYVRRVCDEMFYSGSVDGDPSRLPKIYKEIRRRRRRLKK